MSKPNYERSEEELNQLPLEWERHESRDKWAVLYLPNGRRLTYHMSRRTYRLKGNNSTTKAAPEWMHKYFFTDKDVDYMPFGKHKGHSLEWIAKNKRSYAKWVAAEVNPDWLRDAMAEMIEQVN